MTGLALLTVDGLLRDEASGAPIPTGRALYAAIASVHRLALISDQPASPWLELNGFTDHQFVLEAHPTDPDDPAIRRLRQVERLRGQGAHIALLADPNPGVIAILASSGIPLLHYIHPAYARPEYLPDHEAALTPWQLMVDEVDRVRGLRAADPRPDKDAL
ncbi:hypothetical protein [Nonomuraea typhae]|uniref:hypothetical protein n=1 Tax=Nonomuraea typhae TaxID=2603600 RepID=UPI0012FBD5A8|nr:hypothetical protein [Nonomuraea typhae]